MRGWMVIACAALLCPACAAGSDPPEPESEGNSTTAPPPLVTPPEDDGGSNCEGASGTATSGCEQQTQTDEGDACREACADAAEKGCDWVTSMCEVADSVTLGTLKIPCLVAKLVACGVAFGSPIVCEHLCPD